MTTGISIHIGMDQYSRRYGNLTTVSCITDARELAALAARNNFEAEHLEHPRIDEVRRKIETAQGKLGADNYFVLTFSGHGVPELGGVPRGWLLFNGTVARHGNNSVDTWLSGFKPGVRILVISNTCFAGASVLKTIMTKLLNILFLGERTYAAEGEPLVVPPDVLERLIEEDSRYRELRGFRGKLRRVGSRVAKIFGEERKTGETTFESHVVEIAASKHNELARDGFDRARMTPFINELHAELTLGKMSPFADFVTEVRARCAEITPAIPEPQWMPFAIRNDAYLEVGPYVIK